MNNPSLSVFRAKRERQSDNLNFQKLLNFRFSSYYLVKLSAVCRFGRVLHHVGVR